MSDKKLPPPTGVKWDLREKGIYSREDILHIFETLPPTVKFLDLKGNNIGPEGGIAIAESLKVNNTLQRIFLGHNWIGNEGAIAIAESLKVNNTLQLISLGRNKIGKEGAIAIAESLKVNNTLQRFDINKNKIGKEGAIAIAESLKVNNSLQRIFLGWNEIGPEGAIAIAESLKVNNSLQDVQLQRNKIGPEGAIAIAEPLKANNTLEEIHLRNNEIGNEGAIAIAKSLKVNNSLQHIDLWENEIGSEGAIAIAESLKANSSLRRIDLRGNQIGNEGGKALCEALAFNSTLEEWKRNDDYIPDEFKGMSLNEVRKYFSDAAEGTSQVKELKLLLVGYGGRGKTSLFRSLQGLPPSDLSATDGVDIHSWKLEDLNVHVWDFAGQKTYYATHPLFMSNEAIYLLVWNMREGDPSHELEYWLQSITAKAPQSSIIIVGTHKDQSIAEVPGSLLQRFPQIKSSVQVSNTSSQEGIPELKKKLLEIGKEHEKELPDNYVKLLQFCQSHKGDQYLKLKDVRNEMMGEFTDHKQFERAIEMLHNLGHVLHYREQRDLKKWIILNPQWLIDHLKTVVTSNPQTSHWANDGWIDQSQFPKMWPNLSESLRTFLLDIMDHFRIGIRVNDRFFVPSRLPSKSPKPLSSLPLQREFQLKQGKTFFLPLDIFPSLMTSPQLYFHLARDRCWQEGAVFANETSQSEFLLMVDGKSLQLRGKGQYWMIDIITKAIQELVRYRWKGLELNVSLLCPECNETTFRLKAVQKKFEKNPNSTSECPGCSEDVPVRELLHLVEPSLPKIRNEDLDFSKSLGSGTFGQVWMVQHKQTHATYAAKTHQMDDEDQLKILEEELAVMVALPSHPNVVPLVGWDKDKEKNSLTVFMPSFPLSLYDVIKRNDMKKEFTPKSIAKWSKQILEGLNHLHSNGFVHRDIKPANVLVTLQDKLDKTEKPPRTRSTIKDLLLTDFGTAKKIEKGASTHTVTGTPTHMATEVPSGKYNPVLADVYSFGILLYELLTVSPLPTVEGTAPLGPKPFPSRPVKQKWRDVEAWKTLYEGCTAAEHKRFNLSQVMSSIDQILVNL